MRFLETLNIVDMLLAEFSSVRYSPPPLFGKGSMLTTWGAGDELLTQLPESLSFTNTQQKPRGVGNPEGYMDILELK